MAQGYSLMAAMGMIGFSRQRAYEWAKDYPEFRDAMEIGQAKRSAFLEKRGIDAESGPSVTFAIAALKNCNREAFRDEVSVEHSGPDGKPVKVEWVVTDPTNGG